MTLHDGMYMLSTGRMFFASRGILGLSPERGEYDGRLRATEGYDGGLNFEHEADEQLTAEERREVAEFMCALWMEWAAQPPLE